MTEPNRSITTDPEALARFASNASAHTDARNDERTKRANLRDATAAQRRVHTRLQSGDDTVTTSDLSEGHWEVERHNLLLEAAGRVLKVAERKTRHADLDFGEAVAPLVQGPDLFDCRIVVTDREPAKVDRRSLPILYVVQDSATEDLGAGSIKGRAELYLYTDSRMMAGPTSAEVERVLTDTGWRLIEQAANRPPTVVRHETEEIGGGVWCTRTTVRIGHGGFAWHAAPRLTAPQWGKGLQTDLEGLLWVSAGWRSERTIQVAHDFTSPTLIEHSDGTMTARVTVGYSITPKRLNTDSAEYAANLTRSAQAAADHALASLLGKFIPGMGVVASVSLDAEPFGMAGDVTRYAEVDFRYREVPGVETFEEQDDSEDDEDDYVDEAEPATSADNYGMREDGLVFPYTSK